MVLSAGVVVVREEDGKWRFLLLRAYGYWDFPKGIVEDGEEPLEAAKREVEEETTITDLSFRWGLDYMETAPYRRGTKIARYYLASTSRKEITLPVNPNIGRPEHDAYKWVDLHTAMEMVAERVKPVVKWAAERLGIPFTTGNVPSRPRSS